MKPIEVLSHSDSVSGTTIMEDGRRAHWTEGRSSQVVIAEGFGGGVIDRQDAAHMDEELAAALDNPPAAGRMMTEAEERDWQIARDAAEGN